MKVHETLDERGSGARVVGNGCDVPRPASSFGIRTRPAGPQANGPVTAAQSPTSGAPRARSTRQAHRLRNFFSLLPELDAGQPGMSHHRERDVPIPAVPEAHFVLIEAGLPFGLLDALLDRVTGGGHAHHRLARGLCRGVAPLIPHLVLPPC